MCNKASVNTLVFYAPSSLHTSTPGRHKYSSCTVQLVWQWNAHKVLAPLQNIHIRQTGVHLFKNFTSLKKKRLRADVRLCNFVRCINKTTVCKYFIGSSNHEDFALTIAAGITSTGTVLTTDHGQTPSLSNIYISRSCTNQITVKTGTFKRRWRWLSYTLGKPYCP